MKTLFFFGWRYVGLVLKSLRVILLFLFLGLKLGMEYGNFDIA